MTFNNNKKRTMIAGITASVVLMSISLMFAIFSNSAEAAPQIEDKIPDLYPSPQLTAIHKNAIIDKAMNVQGIKNWSQNGWKFVSMDYFGNAEPTLEWTHAIVHLHLPKNSGTPKAQCENGSWAMVAINLKTLAVEEASFPTDPDKACNSDPSLGSASIPEILDDKDRISLLPTAGAAATLPSWNVAQQNDAATMTIKGSFTWMKTPSFNSNIYSNMDRNISLFFNQQFNTASSFVQEGWRITTPAGCSGCGINANSANLVYVDESVHGDKNVRRAGLFTYTGGNTALVQTICNGGTNYVKQVTYNGQTWQHNTNVACSAADNNSVTNNSVFFENWNTTPSPGWASQLSSAVQSWSAKETVNSQLQNWSASTNRNVTCTSVIGNTNLITGSLANAGTATWSGLSSVGRSC